MPSVTYTYCECVVMMGGVQRGYSESVAFRSSYALTPAVMLHLIWYLCISLHGARTNAWALKRLQRYMEQQLI